jgi:hypothetical protein
LFAELVGTLAIRRLPLFVLDASGKRLARANSARRKNLLNSI